ncbi:MAG: hypothetical protein HOB79_08240 [Rhodospirillaceae bacterium]|jgi:hypothetical protein|nr:hypothetical protein [Rhodospirillaceae bacterium]
MLPQQRLAFLCHSFVNFADYRACITDSTVVMANPASMVLTQGDAKPGRFGANAKSRLLPIDTLNFLNLMATAPSSGVKPPKRRYHVKMQHL